MELTGFQFNGESEELNDRARLAAPGEFVQLPQGETHYQHTGGDVGVPVVLIHGFSVPYFIWEPTFEALAQSGFQVLRYDLFGRGFSDRPDVSYDLNLFVDQLSTLLDRLGLNKPVDLVGLSMGGPIVLAFCDRFPHLVRKICLIDPAGLGMSSSFIGRIIQLPWIGEWLFNLLGNRIFLSQLKKDFADPDRFPLYIEMAKVQLRFKGFKRALLSTMRHDALSDLSQLYSRVGKQERQSLLLWGVEDKYIPFQLNGKVRQAIPRIQFHAIADAGHIPHYEKPEVVNPILINFLLN